MTTILVTGSNGAIGRKLVRYFLQQNSTLQIIGLDRVKNDEYSNDKYLHVQADITQPLQLSLPRPVDCVIHLAALISVSESMSAPADYYACNVVGTMNLLNWMRDSGVERMLFSSTAAIEASSTYGNTKRAAEQLILDYARAFGWRVCILRMYNAAGMMDSSEPIHLIPRLVVAAIKGTSITVYGDGSALRDYVGIYDICRIFYAQWIRLRNSSGEPLSNIMVGTGIGTSILEMIRLVELITGHSIHIKWQPAREGDPQSLVLAKPSEELGPFQTVEKLIRDTCAEYKN